LSDGTSAIGDQVPLTWFTSSRRWSSSVPLAG
jgi:hypothetical protein